MKKLCFNWQWVIVYGVVNNIIVRVRILGLVLSSLLALYFVDLLADKLGLVKENLLLQTDFIVPSAQANVLGLLLSRPYYTPWKWHVRVMWSGADLPDCHEVPSSFFSLTLSLLLLTHSIIRRLDRQVATFTVMPPKTETTKSLMLVRWLEDKKVGIMPVLAAKTGAKPYVGAYIGWGGSIMRQRYCVFWCVYCLLYNVFIYIFSRWSSITK